ncbi:MAG: hypothetical protein NHB32_18910 [Fischerella sp. CENA71]|nr:hypothetical protein [Fischerella sp. CENA71]
MANDSNRFPLQSAIKKILDDPNSRPALPDLGDGISVGDDNFGKADRYDTGVSPSVALNNGNVVVEVHKSQSRDRLFYRVGKVEGDKIDWGKYENNKSIDYDDGVQPSVAITNDGLVVEVHKSQSRDRLFYRVGKVEGDTINWGKYENNKSIDYDDGIQPSVAITNDGLVVEVHKSQNHDTLWYQVGRIDNETITGFNYGNSQSKTYSSNGTVPKVACNGQLAIEAHQEGSDKLWSSILTLPAFRPQWLEDRGPNSYCYFSMGTGFGPGSNERIATSKTITVDPGAPFLLANITQSRESIAFPSGAAMLTIQAPDGTIYNQEESGGNTQVIKSGSSLQSLIVKEPIAGDYHITLTLPPFVAFFFAFETLPSGNLDGIIEGSQELQKRDVDGDREKYVANLLAMLWLIIIRERQSLLFLEEPVGYVTKSKVDILNSKIPTDLAQATDIIAAPIHRILTVEDFRTPPAAATRAPVNGPVIEFVRNSDGALSWVHARIRPNHLNTGTDTNQTMRDFARRLGLPTDQAGHVIASRLGGLGTVEWNIFPQNPNFNMGSYRSDVEQTLYNAVNNTQQPIEGWLRFHYDDPQHPSRPTSFDFCWLLPDGSVIINDLYNPERVPRGA